MNETRQTSECHRLFANRDCPKKKKSTNRGKEKNQNPVRGKQLPTWKRVDSLCYFCVMNNVFAIGIR